MSSCAECHLQPMAAPVICTKCLNELRGRAEELERLKKTKDLMTEEDIKAITLGAAALLFHPELSANAAQEYAGRLYRLQDALSSTPVAGEVGHGSLILLGMPHQQAAAKPYDERVAEMDYLLAVLSKEHDDVKVAERIAELAHSLAERKAGASGEVHHGD